MSVIGTGIAATVAQTAQNAQQVARAQVKQKNDTARLAQQQAALFEQRAHATAQTEDSDQELPDRQAPGYERRDPHPPGDQNHDADGADPTTPGSTPPAAETADAAPLYRHLDIQG